MDFKVTCDGWTSSRGKNLNDAIVVRRITTSEVYESPNLDEIVDEDRTILFETENIQPCNIHITFPTSCCIHSATLVTDCQTLEVFVGKCEEYYKTYYGEFLDDFEGSRIYRFEVDISNTAVPELNLKFIPKDTEIWIYGMVMAIKPNLKVLTSTMMAPSIDFNNVQSILAESKHKLTPNAEKCKEFLRSYVNTKTTHSGQPNLETLLSMMNGNLLCGGSISDELETNGNLEEYHSREKSTTNNASVDSITQYIDTKIEEMEKRINARLDELESKNNAKLDKILELLSKQNDQ